MIGGELVLVPTLKPGAIGGVVRRRVGDAVYDGSVARARWREFAAGSSTGVSMKFKAGRDRFRNPAGN